MLPQIKIRRKSHRTTNNECKFSAKILVTITFLYLRYSLVHFFAQKVKYKYFSLESFLNAHIAKGVLSVSKLIHKRK